MGGGLATAAVSALCAALVCAASAHGEATIVGEPQPAPPPETGAGNPAVAARSGAAGHLGAYTAPTERGDYEVYTRLLGRDGRPIAPPVRVTTLGPRGDRRYNVGSLALLHDDRRDRFLLAYTGLREFAEHRVSARYARLLDRKGRPAGPAFRLSDDARATHELSDEDAAYDPVTRTFAVAWTPESVRAPVQARIVDASGSLIGAFSLSPPNGRAGAPAVAANRATGGFAVAWGEDDRLFTARVDPRRGVAGPFRVALRPPPPAYRDYVDVADPAMAFDSDRREFGVAWSADDDFRASAILFQRLSADGRRALGTPLGASEPSADDQYQTAPAVAFGSGDRTFTVVWEDYEASNSAPICSDQLIQARRIRSGGRPVGDTPQTLSDFDDPSAPGSTNAGGRECRPFPNSPTVATGPSGRGFAALWARWPYVLGTTR